MKNATTGKESHTDFEKLESMKDEDILFDNDTPYDPNDPLSIEAFWKDAKVEKPKSNKVEITLQVSTKVIAYFKATTGNAWQSSIDDVLQKYVELKQS
jgi:uncharacterized protein (DUF4415 family)